MYISALRLETIGQDSLLKMWLAAWQRSYLRIDIRPT